jgi:MoaA/NifB/PqqE/SkfB family radical SAM enzyme
MSTTSPDLSHMLQETLAGRDDHSRQILAEIRAFPHIILHGAGLFGREILEFLETAGVEKGKISWWDYSYDKPAKIKGIPVFPPFTGDFSPKSTLVIHSIRDASMESQAVPEGYSRLDGALLYKCSMCPFKVGGGSVMSLCARNSRCGVVRCPKLKNGTSGPDKSAWPLDWFGFIIGQKCTLACKHCNLYLNHFSRQDRMMFPARQIMEDIQRISATYDFIRSIGIVGGEAFLHPDLSAIVGCALSRDNFGVIRVLTNGVCAISDEMIDILKHERCLVQFTDYTEQLTEKQKRLFQRNIEKIDRAGIGYYAIKEVWKYPPTLHCQGYSKEQMRKMKAACEGHKSCRQAVNGVYYPCGPAVSIRQHHLSDYTSDRVILAECVGVEELRDKIANCDNQPFYESCRHCDLSGKSITPGEQGIDARYLHLGSERNSSHAVSDMLNDPWRTPD